MGSSAQLLTRISADSGPFTKAIGEVNQALDKAFQRAGASTRGFQALGNTLSGLGSTLSLSVTAPMLALGAASVRAATQIDSLKRGLTTVTGSAAATEVEFRKLRETAKLPGIDFEQAVRGSIRLQTLGVSADKARVIMGNFGNALAAAGGTKADFGEIIRQLSQLSSSATVTKENLDPIIDRVPAVAAIIREKFGPEALGDPAKVFKALGISGIQLADILSNEVGFRVPKITGSARSAFESFSDAVNDTAGRIGDKLLPSVTKVLPKLESLVGFAADAVDEFTKLPGPVQDTALALGVITVTAGPALTAVNGLIAAYRTLAGLAGATGLLGIFAQTVPAAKGAADAYFLVGGRAAGVAVAAKAAGVGLGAAAGAAAGAGVAVAGILTPLLSTQTALENQEKAAAKAQAGLEGYGRAIADQTKPLLELLETNEDAYDSVLKFARGVSAAKPVVKTLTGDLKDKTKAVDALAEAYNTLGVANTTDAIGGFVKAREAVAVVQRAYEAKKASSVDLQRATEALGQAYLKLIDGLGGIRPKAEEVGIAFDFARERALSAIGDIQLAASGARNISLGQLIVPGQSNTSVLDSADTARSSRRNLDLIRQTAQGATGAWTQTRTAISRQVSTITTDFSRAVADIVTGATSAGEAFKRLGQSVAQSLIRTIVENGVNVAIKALGNLLSSLGGVGKAIGGIFGGGGSSAAGSVGGGGIGGGAASGGALPIIGAVTGVVSAISGVFSNFQFAAMNKTLDLIEKEVRFSQIHLLYILEKINQYLPELANIHQRLIEFRNLGVKIEGGGGATPLVINFNGPVAGGPNAGAEIGRMIARELKLQGVR